MNSFLDPNKEATFPLNLSLSPFKISSVEIESFSLMIGIAPSLTKLIILL